jgi:DNA-binding transcriptional MerR regulator
MDARRHGESLAAGGDLLMGIGDRGRGHGRAFDSAWEFCLTRPGAKQRLSNDSTRTQGIIVHCNIALPSMTETTLTIAELAREFELTPRTIRYYEDQGILAPRREGLQRVYSKRDRTRLKLALRGKRLGLSLAEIRELINMYDTAADQSPQLVKFLTVLSRRRAALEQQRRDIEAVLSEIRRFEKQCEEILRDEAPAKNGRQVA